jgi:uncharacterized protein DUF4129
VQGPSDPATFRAVLDSVFSAPAYRWASQPSATRLLHRWWDRLGEWLQGLQSDNPAVFRYLVMGLLLALILIFLHAGYLIWQTMRGASPPANRARPSAPPVPHDAEWYEREADRAAAAGRRLEALQLAFVALALRLESQGRLRYHASKTPAECAAEAHLADNDRELMRQLVRALYGYVFGGRPCGPEDYRRWRDMTTSLWHAPAS